MTTQTQAHYLFNLAIDYHCADAQLRNGFAMATELMPSYLDRLENCPGVEECVILSTCNRTELYLVIDDPKRVASIMQWWESHARCQVGPLKNYAIVRQGESVVAHLMQLACGLESMVLGEPQILGQLKDAYGQALQADTTGTMLNRLFQKAFSVAKKVRSQTKLGQCPVSVAYSAVKLAQSRLNDLSDKHVLIVGAGQTGQLMARHIQSCQPKALWIANRTYEKATALAQLCNGTSFPLSDLATYIQQADMIIACVTTQHYIIQSEWFNQSNKPQLIFDLSVPFAVDPAVDAYAMVERFCVDDIDQVIQANKSRRQQAAQYAQSMIQQGIRQYQQQTQALPALETVKAMRGQTYATAETLLHKYTRRLNHGQSPSIVLQRFAHEMTNKWLHHPSIALKQAAIAGDNTMFDYAQKLFDLKIGSDHDESITTK